MNNYSEAKAAYLQGGEVKEATVCCEVSAGIGIHIVGLPDSAVKETLLRVVTAMTSAGYRVPGKKIVIYVKPVDGIKKSCTGFDLPIAVALLAASGQIECYPQDAVYHAEIALDGRLGETGDEGQIAEKVRENGGALVCSWSFVGPRKEGERRGLLGCVSLQQLISFTEVVF